MWSKKSRILVQKIEYKMFLPKILLDPTFFRPNIFLDVHSWEILQLTIANLSYNFNYNIVESWD